MKTEARSQKSEGRRQKPEVRRRKTQVRSIVVVFTIVLCIIFEAAFGQASQQYFVVRVVGKVESPVLKREIKTGDVIQLKDQLKFVTKDAYLIVNSPQTGRKRISGVPDSSPREVLQLLQSFVQPELKSTASRNIALKYLESLQNSMGFDTLLVLSNGFVPVNTEKLTLTKPAIIRAWHYDDTKKVIYQTISDPKGFYLNSQSLYGDNLKSHTYKKVIVEYFEDEKEDPTFSPGLLLAAFVPLYVDEAALAPELKALVAGLDKTKTKAAIFTEINMYLRDEYAAAQESNLKTWLKAQGIVVE